MRAQFRSDVIALLTGLVAAGESYNDAVAALRRAKYSVPADICEDDVYTFGEEMNAPVTANVFPASSSYSLPAEQAKSVAQLIVEVGVILERQWRNSSASTVLGGRAVSGVQSRGGRGDERLRSRSLDITYFGLESRKADFDKRRKVGNEEKKENDRPRSGRVFPGIGKFHRCEMG